MKLVLLHSPLVSAATWSKVAPLLRARGHTVATPDLAPALRAGPPYYPRLAEAVAARDAILVVHSGAGALVPAIAARTPPAGAIFVDALLPHPGKAWFETVPEALGARLRALAKDGWLPPWHRWWPDGALRPLFVDDAAHDAFVADLTDLPLDYFEESAPAVPLAMPSAYLQLSEGYGAEAAAAERAGWPHERLALNHLAMLSQPGPVGAAIERLAMQLR